MPQNLDAVLLGTGGLFGCWVGLGKRLNGLEESDA